jgi:hypothetical protein
LGLPDGVILVRFLLFLALATIAVAAILYLFRKDRRYLRFIGQVIKYTIYLLAGVMVFYALDRILLAV